MTFVIRQEHPEDDYAVDCLVAKAFGPGRFAKSAYRYRDNNTHISELAYIAENHLSHIVGTIRYWPMKNETDILLGPLAVDGELRSMGLGINLMYISLEKAENLGYKRIILVGDPKYYKRFGFERQYAEDISFLGPVDHNRLLGKML